MSRLVSYRDDARIAVAKLRRRETPEQRRAMKPTRPSDLPNLHRSPCPTQIRDGFFSPKRVTPPFEASCRFRGGRSHRLQFKNFEFGTMCGVMNFNLRACKHETPNIYWHRCRTTTCSGWLGFAVQESREEPQKQSEEGVQIDEAASQLMQGYPPAPEHVVQSVDLHSSDDRKRIWAQQHVRELCRTQEISRGNREEQVDTQLVVDLLLKFLSLNARAVLALALKRSVDEGN